MSSTSSSSSLPSKANRTSGGGGSIHGPRPHLLIVSPAAAAEVSRPSKKPLVIAAGETAGPVIVYELTPRVVHARPEEFRAVVQKLTGNGKKTMATTTAPSDSTVRLTEQVVAGGGGEAAGADPLVLALGQQRQPAPVAPPAADTIPPSPAAANFLLSPSSLFLSPTTMHALQDLGVLF